MPSTVTVEKIADAAEGGSAGVFRLTRTGDLSSELVVNIALGGTAVPGVVPDSGVDYNFDSAEVIFAANSAHTDIVVGALHDDVYDPDETVTVTLQSGTGYTVGTQNSATLTIHEDARHTFELSGVPGAVWYDIAFDQVDPTAATDTAALTNFQLEFNGQTFAVGTPGFSPGNPVAVFACGVFQYIQFDVTFQDPVAGFSRLTADNGQVQGTDATTGLPGNPAALQNKGQATIHIDFAPMAFRAGGVDWTVVGRAGGQDFGGGMDGTINIPANGTPGLVRDAMVTLLRSFGLSAEPQGDTRLTVTGPAGKQLSALSILVNLDPPPAGPAGTVVQGGAAVEPRFFYGLPAQP